MADVVIIGGGPAGSTLGWYLSRAGIDNTIFEASNHPRHHVGESIVPATTRIFEEMGFLETLEREGFVRKYGASWHAAKTSQVVTPQERIPEGHRVFVFSRRRSGDPFNAL